ncbi:uncharacterized protein LOC135198336 [Macrobrachium nipponense]|uniref:uncharacterized protein LOC135198336 n=1 Tax=Macrobrachium nipponense TaxID=159736 RepID=UPI0030C7BC4B
MPLRFTTDASNIACRAVLERMVQDIPQPLSFFSRKLSPPETRYSTFDCELLAVYQAVHHFCYLLEGAPFTIRTDHCPLVHAFTKAGNARSVRQQRHLAAIAGFGCTIHYVPSEKNAVADALSRIEINAVHLRTDYEGLTWEQAADPVTAAYRTALTSLKWEDVPFGPSGKMLLCDTSTGLPLGLDDDAPPDGEVRLAQNSEGLSRVGQELRPVLIKQNKPPTESAWGSSLSRNEDSHIRVEVVGPLPPSKGARYLLTIIDRSTKWP